MAISRVKQKKGVVLIFVYLIVVSLLIVTGAVIHRAVNEFNLARRNKLYTEALYFAEGGLESITYLLAYNTANHLAEPVTDGNPSTEDLIPNLPPLFLSDNFSLAYECELEEAEYASVNPIGITTFIAIYKISTYARYNNELLVTLNQLVARKKRYTFQHAVFYADDLEMLPGPNMTLSGRVHSNSDIYLGTHNTFTIDSDYLYSAENIYNRRKDSSSSMNGNVSIQIKDSSPIDYALMKEGGEVDPLDCDRADWMDESQNRWAGAVKSGVHGVTSLTAPAVASIQIGEYYDNNSGVRVENGAITKDGSPLVEGVDIPVDTLETKTFYNHREGETAKVTNIDLRKLAGYDAGDPEGSPSFPNNFPDNGLMYATRTDATGGDVPGVRLVNGGKIDHQGGLTVVSDVAVYLQGDYNKYDYDGDEVKDKKPAAIICDSLNILSNDWDDANSQNPSDVLDQRDVSGPTEVNAAFIAGVKLTPDGGGNYSGGLENYPRLLEKWSNEILTIRGSFVELWESLVAQGDWEYGGFQYKAPVRNWDYDTDFNDTNNLPPFTPFAVEIEGIGWWLG